MQPRNDDEMRAALARLACIPADRAALVSSRDAEEMVRLLARSNYLTAAQRRLFELELVTPPADRPFTRGSAVRAGVLLALTLIALAITCGLFGRIVL